MAGPFYVANVPNGYKVAPDDEISKAVIIKGQVLDRNCDPVVGAVVGMVTQSGMVVSLLILSPDPSNDVFVSSQLTTP